MLSGGHGPSHSAPGRLVCVLGERDVHLLSVRLLQGTSVLSVPPVPAMSGAWGWVWWCQHPWVQYGPMTLWAQSWVVPGAPVLLQCCPDARLSICL